MSLRVLLLGGTTEASALARLLAANPAIEATISLAGVTLRPALSPIPRRIGGFGGAAGLAAYLDTHHIDRLVDATHPFASRITANAVDAATTTGTPVLRLTRPPWRQTDADRWHHVPSLQAAADHLGTTPRRVFLTVGRGDLAPFLEAAPRHHYTVRSIDRPAQLPPGATLILARGPYEVDAETALLQAHRIDIVVTKNAGGTATRAKLEAARALGLPVILVARPPEPPIPQAATPEDALAWLQAAAHRGA